MCDLCFRTVINESYINRPFSTILQWFREYRSPTSYTRGGLELAIACMPVYRPSTSKPHCNGRGFTQHLVLLISFCKHDVHVVSATQTGCMLPLRAGLKHDA